MLAGTTIYPSEEVFIMKYRHYHYTFTERETGEIREGYVRASSKKEARDRFMHVKGPGVADGTEPDIKCVPFKDHLKSRCVP